jgi:GT2 family glycosyltransferase
MKLVSVVIPTYNRLDRLKRVLNALEAQTCALDCFEVVIVSDGSTDGTNEYLNTLNTPLDLQIVAQANKGVAAARNLGVTQARGEIILFLDDDVVPTPTLITEHLQTHARNTDDVVVLGPMLSPPDFKMTTWVRYEQAMLYKQYRAMQAGDWEPTARQFYTGNASLARQHFINTGGFDETFYRAEDVELAYRLAARRLRFVFNADAIGYHYAERSFESWLTIPYVYGRNDIIFARDKGQQWLFTQIPQELKARNVWNRNLVRLCSPRPWLSAILLAILKVLVRVGQSLAPERLMQMAHSSIFTLRYFQGVLDESDGHAFFLTQKPKL